MPWLVKTEPEEYGLNDLKKVGVGRWDGVRNYKARNHMRACLVDDLVLIYHSGKKPKIVGIAEVARVAYPDPAQFDPESDYYDAKATPENPRWVALDLRYVGELKTPVSLAILKSDERFQDMEMLRQTRLSVAEVGQGHFDLVLALGQGLLESGA
jgi:predicted RNA-binding protein with PUA-like domain